MGFFKRNLGNRGRGGGGRGGSTANSNRKRPAAAASSGSGKFTNSTKKSKFDGKKKLLDKKRNRRQERDDEEIPSSEGEFDDDSAGEEGLFDDELGGEGSTRPSALDEEEHGEQQQYEDEQALAYREAKLLLDSVKEPGALAAADDDEEETALADELEMETAAARLRKQEQAKAAKAHRKVADQVRFAVVDNGDERPLIITTYRPHRLSPVCLCFSSNGQFLISCSKDGSVVKYDLQKRCRVGQLKQQASNKKAKSKTANKPKTVANTGPDATSVNNCHHKGPVLCCAISPGDKYLVTGGADRLIKIWDFASLGHVRDFDGHRGPVTCLRFRQQCEALEMFSSSTDRSIMVWNMDELGLMNTLYGHQDAIEQLDILQWPRVLACGGMDKSCRFFKVLEDSHLVFNGFAECISIDCVALINEEHFISGCADGSLYVWSMGRKKPVFVRRRAHGCHSSAVQQSGSSNHCSGPLPPAEEATIAADNSASNNNGNIRTATIGDNTVQPAEVSANRKNGGGEPRWISAVASLPYTDLVATGSSDGFLRLWRLAQDWKALDPVDQFPMALGTNNYVFILEKRIEKRPMNAPGNTLVVHVVAATGLYIKGQKPVDVYCSLATSGKGPWKSKVNTNALRAEPGQQQANAELRWDEHCEFQLNDTDSKLVLHVNHKTGFGTTETLGELVFQLDRMARFQPPAWFRLTKGSDAQQQQQQSSAGGAAVVPKERGQLQLGYQFSNSLGVGAGAGGTSVSNVSLNRIEKEKKLTRIRRKMQQLGRKATGGIGGGGGGAGSSSTAGGDGDTQSLASISIAAGQQSSLMSRRSSMSSTNSGALAFSSPSPHPPTPIPPTATNNEEAVSQRKKQAEDGSGTTLGFSSSMASAAGWLSRQQQHHQQQQPPLVVQSSRKGGSRAAVASSWANAASSSGGGGGSSSANNSLSISTTGDNTRDRDASSLLLAAAVSPRPRASAGGGQTMLTAAATQQQQEAHSSILDFDQHSIGDRSSVSGGSVFGGGGTPATLEQQSTPSSSSQHPKLRVKMRQKAEQLLQLRALTGGGTKKQQQQKSLAQQPGEYGGDDHHHQQTADQFSLPGTHRRQRERTDSVASSSGFVSFGSGQLSALNEQTSPEHLLNVIKHLRKELRNKEERIRDLEQYTDKLVTKVMMVNPELLAASPKLAAPKIRH